MLMYRSSFPIVCAMGAFLLSAIAANAQTVAPSPVLPTSTSESAVSPAVRALVQAVADAHTGIAACSFTQSYLSPFSCIGPTFSRIDFVAPNKFRRVAQGLVGTAPASSVLVVKTALTGKEPGFAEYGPQEIDGCDLRALLLNPQKWQAKLLSASELRLETPAASPGAVPDQIRLVARFDTNPVIFTIDAKTHHLLATGGSTDVSEAYTYPALQLTRSSRP